MPSNIADPWHSAAMVLVVLIAVMTYLRALRRSERFLGLAVGGGAVAELMKGSWIIEHFVEPTIGLVLWRALVHILCLVSMLLLLEAVRASLWGPLWDATVLRGGGVGLAVAAVVLTVIAAATPGGFDRVEQAGGVLPVVYLAAFAVPMFALAVSAAGLAWVNRTSAAVSLWVVVVVIIGYAADAAGLVVRYVLAGPDAGEGGGNGLPWGGLLLGAAAVGAGTLRRVALTAAESREARLVALWFHLAGHAGVSDPARLLRSYKRGGRALAWIYVLRSCVDWVASDQSGSVEVIATADDLDEVAGQLGLGADGLRELGGERR